MRACLLWASYERYHELRPFLEPTIDDAIAVPGDRRAEVDADTGPRSQPLDVA